MAETVIMPADGMVWVAGIVTYRGLINSGLHEMVQLPPSQSTGVYHTHPFSVILWTSALQDVLRHQEQVDNTLRKFQRALSTDAPICSKAGAVCEAYRALFVPLNALLQHQAASTRWVVHLSTSPHVSASVAPDAPVHQTSGDDVADPTISRPAKRQRVPWPDVALRLLRDRQCRLGGPTSRVCITVEAKQAAVLGDAADLPAAWNNGNAAVQAVLAQAFGQMDMFQTSLGAILTLKHVWLLQRPEDQPGTVQVRSRPAFRHLIGQAASCSVARARKPCSCCLHGVSMLGGDVCACLCTVQS